MKTTIIAAAATVVAFASTPASAFTEGQFSVTFYGGQHHVKGATQCLNLTHVGDIAGFDDSGTWDSSTFDFGWGGNFIVDKNVIRLYGTYSPGDGRLVVTNFYAKLKTDKGGYDTWTASSTPITGTNDGWVALTSGCKPGRSAPTTTPMG